MIHVIDNFLPGAIFERLQQHCKTEEWSLITAGDKQFSTIDVPEEVEGLLNLPGNDIVLTFIRRAYKGFDNDLRIHCDGIIMNRETSYASVLYLNNEGECTPSGTAFYDHEKHGPIFSDSEEEFNRLLLEDSNDETKWKIQDYIQARPNRLLTYDSSMFHAKFPKEIEKGERIVLVCFYSKSE